MKRQNGQTIDLYFTYGESPMLLITDAKKRNIGFSKKNEIWIDLEKKLDAKVTTSILVFYTFVYVRKLKFHTQSPFNFS